VENRTEGGDQNREGGARGATRGALPTSNLYLRTLPLLSLRVIQKRPWTVRFYENNNIHSLSLGLQPRDAANFILTTMLLLSLYGGAILPVRSIVLSPKYSFISCSPFDRMVRPVG
jgi:hypothetical protein